MRWRERPVLERLRRWMAPKYRLDKYEVLSHDAMPIKIGTTVFRTRFMYNIVKKRVVRGDSYAIYYR